MPEFDYSNLSGRPTGPFVRIASLFLPGVRAVQNETAPYAASWGTANRAALAGTGPLWVALGDSLTQGLGASAFDRGWVGQLAARMPSVRVVNLAVSGARVADVVDRQLPALEALDEAPALVTLLIGSNDLFRRRHREQLPATFELLLNRLPPGSIVATLPNPNATATALNTALERAVGRRGLVLAELRRPQTTSWRGKLAADHFHPNDLGYTGIAEVFAEAFHRAGITIAD